MAEPPSSFDAVHETDALSLPAVAVTPVGEVGGVVGFTEKL
jgi:hypothetical protein